MGEIPVGMAAVLPMNQAHFPFLILAPTMRIPSNVSQSINSYLAMRAILIAVLQYNKLQKNPITSISISGLCTGVGRMPFQEAAKQMRIAYNNVYLQEWKRVVHPAMAPYVLRK